MVNETVLSRMVKEFGDVVMGTITSDLYGSGLVYLVVLVGGTAALLSLAFSLHKGEAPVRSIMFFATWFACLPVGGRPLAYGLVNGFGTALSYQLQKSTLKILGAANAQKPMPPGWVVNALVRAAASEITDPQVQDDVLYVMENCVPSVANKNGDPLTAADLFGGEIRQSTSGAEVFTERFDPQLLKARKFQRGGQTVNCYDLLTSTRARLRTHLAGKDLTKMPEKNYLGPSSGEVQAAGAVKTTWDAPSTRESSLFRQTSLNVATAAAVQKVAMGLDPEKVPKWLPVSRAIEDHTAAPVSAYPVGSAGGNLTAITFDLMSAPGAIARALNIDGAVTSGALLQEMNEKLLSLPYYIAFVQSVLKILAPLAILTLLFGTFKFFFTWSFGWILTLIMPVVMELSRGISNAILMHTNKLTEVGHLLETEPGFMALGINFDAANKIIEDSSRMMNVFLNVELGIWAALLMMIPAGAYLAGNVANRVTAQFAHRLVSMAARRIGAAPVARAFGATVVAQQGSTVIMHGNSVAAVRHGSGGTSSYAARSVTLARDLRGNGAPAPTGAPTSHSGMSFTNVPIKPTNGKD